MGEIAGVAASFFRLVLIVGKQLIDLFGHRSDLGRKIAADAGLLAGTDVGDFLAHAAQGPQPEQGLQRGEYQQADAERGEAPDEGRPQPVDLVIDGLSRLRDLEAPAYGRTRKDHVPFGNSQRLGMAGRGKFVAVVEMLPEVDVRTTDAQATIP